MPYILTGVFGFLIGYGFEMLYPKNIPLARPVLGILAGGFVLYSIVMLCVTSERFWLPVWLVAGGWVLLPVVTIWFLRALIFELPFKTTFGIVRSGHYLVTTGSYSLVRHPTVPLFTLILVAVLLISRAKLLLFAIPIWVFMDVLWAFLQERVILAKTFPEYQGYRQSTPMFIPGSRVGDVVLKAFSSMKSWMQLGTRSERI